MQHRVPSLGGCLVLLLAHTAFASSTDLRVIRTKLQRVATATDTIIVLLSGSKEVPANASTATGTAILFLNTNSNTLSFDITHNVGGETTAHIHGPAGIGSNAGVKFTLPAGAHKVGTWSFSEVDEPMIREELTYIDIHSGTFPGGEIRGQIETCVNKPAIQGVQACLHVVVQNLGPDPYDGVALHASQLWLAPGKLQVTVDIDEPSKPGLWGPRVNSAFSITDSLAVDIAVNDSVDVDLGPVDYFPASPGSHKTTSTPGATGANIDPNPSNDTLIAYIYVLMGTPAAGPLALVALFAALVGLATHGLRRRQHGSRSST